MLAVVLFIFLLIILSINSAKWFVDDGKKITGIEAIKKAKEEKSKYNSVITEKVVANIITQYKDISNNSIDGSLTKKQSIIIQPIDELVHLIDASFGEFHSFNYYKCGTLLTSQSHMFYENRINMLIEWINTNPEAQVYSKNERKFIVDSAVNLKTPFKYSYMDGWKTVIQNISYIIFILFFILIIIVVPVFSSEYQSGMDTILFSTLYGKTKVGYAKVISVYIISTLIYWLTVLFYSITVLLVYGFDGWECLIQTNYVFWKSYYQLTNLQLFMTILGLGYLGSLLLVSLTMVISAKVKSMFQTVVPSFLILIVPMILSSSNRFWENILNLFPHNISYGAMMFQLFNLYDLGGKVFSQVHMFLIVYIPMLIIMPWIALYFYRNHRVN